MKRIKRSGLLLTNRELKVLKLLSTGLTCREASEQLYIAKRTVDFHMHNIRKKLGAKNLMQAIRAAKRLDLIAFDPMS